ncbi:hypothetical protein RHO12_00855 [Orbus sturtevantii]|uniref:hypothetical protein n=1 Tax=Orbus sturtevantii TaxID=3074109 RepID=UPI00370D5D17
MFIRSTTEDVIFNFTTMFSFGGFLYIAHFIYPNSIALYGLDAPIGDYFLIPIFLMSYGILVYFFGLSVINRKVYDHSDIFNINANQTKKRVNKHLVYFIPVQIWGLISACIGLFMLLIQIIYRLIYM